MHMLLNSIGIYWMAPPTMQILGNAGFLGFYLVSALVTSATSLWWHNNVKHRPISSTGASGSSLHCYSFAGR